MGLEKTDAAKPNSWEKLSRNAQILWRKRNYPSKRNLLFCNPEVAEFIHNRSKEEISLLGWYVYREIILVDRAEINKSELGYWAGLLDYVSSIIEEEKKSLLAISDDRAFGMETKELAKILGEKASDFVSKFLLPSESLS